MHIVFILCMLLLGSCMEHGGGTSQRDYRPVKSVIASTSEVVNRDFVGLSTPMMSVNLAFKISGQIIDIPVVKGEDVNEGELLCSIDPRDIELQLISDKSTFEEAKSSYERAQRLLSHDAVSIQEMERARSSYLTARSVYENSLEILSETSILAPFRAVVEIVYIDQFQRVQAGESVIRIVSPTTCQVEFTLPERSLQEIKNAETQFSVRFDNIPNVIFSAKVTEFARTSSDASGFPVTLMIDNPDSLRYPIRSGMSCTITMSTPQRDEEAVILPLSSIYSPTAGGSYIWIVDSLNRVELRRVTLEEPTGTSSVVVTGGVKSGDRVVTAGVYQLHAGESVKIID